MKPSKIIKLLEFAESFVPVLFLWTWYCVSDNFETSLIVGVCTLAVLLTEIKQEVRRNKYERTT